MPRTRKIAPPPEELPAPVVIASGPPRRMFTNISFTWSSPEARAEQAAEDARMAAHEKKVPA